MSISDRFKKFERSNKADSEERKKIPEQQKTTEIIMLAKSDVTQDAKKKRVEDIKTIL